MVRRQCANGLRRLGKERKNMDEQTMGLLLLYGASTISVWGALALVLFGVRRFVNAYHATLEDGGEPEEYMEKIAAYVTGKRADLTCVGISLLSPIVILAGALFLFLLVRPLVQGIKGTPYNVMKA